ncbi:nucleotidyltransferase domain-containing protein [Candidatus Peregrinibacteria bacterium]|nr:MAG: nucleotidyltransferase domain-containing protein [Candidatus Peregrinibacteria bacterium]
MTVSNKKDIGLKEEQLTSIQALAKKVPEISKIILFGSRAKGTHKERSDVDLCLVLENPESSDSLHFKLDLEEETVIPYQFDVVYLDAIKDPRFKAEILNHGKIIYTKA